MILTDWLPVWNMAVKKIGKPLLPNVNLSAQTTDEAKLVLLYWDRVLAKVLADHDILVAVKTVFLGTETVDFIPTLPVGATELATGMIRKPYFTLPSYDASGTPAAGTVPFEIIRAIELSNGQTFVPQGPRLMVPTAVTGQNVYANVVVKPTAPEAGKDDAFVAALYLALAMEIAPQVSGKDRYRDLKLQDEYDRAITDCRYYDNNTGKGPVASGWWSPLSDQNGTV